MMMFDSTTMDVMESANQGTTSIVNMLDNVIANRNKRKAKQVVKTGVEFMFSVALLLIATFQDEEYYPAVDGVVLGFLSILYVLILSILIMVHASNLPAHMTTTLSIEQAYSKTNRLPFIDGVLEIPIAFRNGAKIAAIGLWTAVFLLCAFLTAVLFTTFSGPYLVGSILAATMMYDFTSDFLEYWVFTRPENMQGTNS